MIKRPSPPAGSQEPSDYVKRFLRGLQVAIKVQPGESAPTLEDTKAIIYSLVSTAVVIGLRTYDRTPDLIMPISDDVCDYLWDRASK